jgi:hypothetical protein
MGEMARNSTPGVPMLAARFVGCDHRLATTMMVHGPQNRLSFRSSDR